MSNFEEFRKGKQEENFAKETVTAATELAKEIVKMQGRITQDNIDFLREVIRESKTPEEAKAEWLKILMEGMKTCMVEARSWDKQKSDEAMELHRTIKQDAADGYDAYVKSNSIIPRLAPKSTRRKGLRFAIQTGNDTRESYIELKRELGGNIEPLSPSEFLNRLLDGIRYMPLDIPEPKVRTIKTG